MEVCSALLRQACDNNDASHCVDGDRPLFPGKKNHPGDSKRVGGCYSTFGTVQRYCLTPVLSDPCSHWCPEPAKAGPGSGSNQIQALPLQRWLITGPGHLDRCWLHSTPVVLLDTTAHLTSHPRVPLSINNVMIAPYATAICGYYGVLSFRKMRSSGGVCFRWCCYISSPSPNDTKSHNRRRIRFFNHSNAYTCGFSMA